MTELCQFAKQKKCLYKTFKKLLISCFKSPSSCIKIGWEKQLTFQLTTNQDKLFTKLKKSLSLGPAKNLRYDKKMLVQRASESVQTCLKTSTEIDELNST